MQFIKKSVILLFDNTMTKLREDICPLSIHVMKEKLNKERGVQMSKKEQYEARTEELILPIIDRMNFELVDVEYVKEGSVWYLRAYIDKEGGITVNDCEAVAREMNEILDREDYVEGSYTFEVSSPGLGRPLKKEKDYKRSMGKELEIRTYRAINREKEFYGILKAYDDATVTLEMEDGTEMKFEKAEIALIRLALDF